MVPPPCGAVARSLHDGVVVRLMKVAGIYVVVVVRIDDVTIGACIPTAPNTTSSVALRDRFMISITLAIAEHAPIVVKVASVSSSTITIVAPIDNSSIVGMMSMRPAAVSSLSDLLTNGITPAVVSDKPSSINHTSVGVHAYAGHPLPLPLSIEAIIHPIVPRLQA